MSIDALQDKIRAMKNPSMVGLDPTEDLIPLHILDAAYAQHGETPAGLAAAFEVLCFELLDTLKDTVPAVKLQSVCFEVLGAPGITVMERVAARARELGYYVVVDALRSDAPHIAELSAKRFFGHVSIGSSSLEPFPCDGLTLNGYMGSESVRPYLQYCKEDKKNIFLMLRSSNRGGREVQDLLTGGRSVHTAMADLLMRWTPDTYGRFGYSEVAALVGAYDGAALAELRRLYPKVFFLVTGYGAQGGTAKPVSNAFDLAGHGAVVAASRSIIGAWKAEESDGSDYCQQALAAAQKMKKSLSGYIIVM